MSFYLMLKPIDRTFYEIIYSDTHCKLYFDIEYDKVLNPNNDGKGGLASFVYLLRDKLFTLCGINSSLFGEPHIAGKDSDGELYIMDATDANKFSKHIILHLDHIIIFKDQYDVRMFVLFMEKTIMEIYKANLADVLGLSTRRAPMLSIKRL